MKNKFIGDLKISWIDTIVIIELPPEEYYSGIWGQLLDLVRDNYLRGSTDIVIDFSEVTSLGDMGLETHILREEYQKNGGRNVYHFCMPQFMKIPYDIMLQRHDVKKIREFESLEDAISHIKNLGKSKSQFKKENKTRTN